MVELPTRHPELFQQLGIEPPKGVREIFSKARENAPTVVFFDEIDSIATERGQCSDDSGVGERVGNVRVTAEHFEDALTEVTASDDEETEERYEEIEQRFDKRDPEVEEEQVGRTFH